MKITSTSANTSFSCNRKAFLAAISTVRMPKTTKLYIVTEFAINRINLKTSVFDVPVECIDHAGLDTTIIIPLFNMKEFCKCTTDTVLRFIVNGKTLQINNTILSL